MFVKADLDDDGFVTGDDFYNIMTHRVYWDQWFVLYDQIKTHLFISSSFKSLIFLKNSNLKLKGFWNIRIRLLSKEQVYDLWYWEKKNENFLRTKETKIMRKSIKNYSNLFVKLTIFYTKYTSY